MSSLGRTWDYNEPFVLSFMIGNTLSRNITMRIVLDGVTILDNRQWARDSPDTLERLNEYVNNLNVGTTIKIGCIFPVYSSITMTPSDTALLWYVRVYKYVEA